MLTSKMKAAAIRTALKHMFRRGWFDICAFKECAELADVFVPRETLAYLSVLHCVHFNEMEPGMPNTILDMCQKTFTGDGLPLHRLDAIGAGKETETFTDDRMVKAIEAAVS